MLLLKGEMMLTAYNNRKKVFAKDMFDRELEYLCPWCEERLILVKPIENIIDHFRHHVESICPLEPETKEHEQGKRNLYDIFSKYGTCELETTRFLDLGFKPDIYIEYDDRKIVVEFQCYPLSMLDFLTRTSKYTKEGIYACWIFGTENFDRDSEKGEDVKKVCAVEKKAHEIYFGNVYYFDGIALFSNKYKPYSEIRYPNEYAIRFHNANSYNYYYKGLRRLVETTELFNPFILPKRNTWRSNNFLVACLSNKNNGGGEKIMEKYVLFQDDDVVYSTNNYFWSNFFTTKESRDRMEKNFDDKAHDEKYWENTYRGFPKKQKITDTLRGRKDEENEN